MLDNRVFDGLLDGYTRALELVSFDTPVPSG